MLRYIIIFMIFLYQAKSITIKHNQSSIIINGNTYKSSLVKNSNTEYTTNEQELIIANHYYSRNKTVEYFVFNKNTLNLKKHVTISCDNFTQICLGSINEFNQSIHISQTIDETFLDNTGNCNIELISTYPSDNMNLDKVAALKYREVTYKINKQRYTFLYTTLYKPNRMYLTEKYTLYIPFCNTDKHQSYILECKILDGDFRTYTNIQCTKKVSILPTTQNSHGVMSIQGEELPVIPPIPPVISQVKILEGPESVPKFPEPYTSAMESRTDANKPICSPCE